MAVVIANREDGETVRRVVQDGDEYDFAIDGPREYTFKGEGEAPDDVVEELEEWIRERHGPLPHNDVEKEQPEGEIDAEGPSPEDVQE